MVECAEQIGKFIFDLASLLPHQTLLGVEPMLNDLSTPSDNVL